MVLLVRNLHGNRETSLPASKSYPQGKSSRILLANCEQADRWSVNKAAERTINA